MINSSLSVDQLHKRLVKVEDTIGRVLYWLSTAQGCNVERHWNPRVLISMLDSSKYNAINVQDEDDDSETKYHKSSHLKAAGSSIKDELINRRSSAPICYARSDEDEMELELPINSVLVECTPFSVGGSLVEEVTSAVEEDISIIAAVHDMTDKKHTCQICGKYYSSLGRLHRHKAISHDIRRTRTCRVCDQTFSSSNSLNRHVAGVHLKIRNFNCSICNQSFKAKSHLKNHMATVHHHSRKFPCKFCTVRFKTNFLRNVHVKNVHHPKSKSDFRSPHIECETESNPRNPLENSIKCEICDGVFSSMDNLWRHQKLHPELKEFKVQAPEDKPKNDPCENAVIESSQYLLIPHGNLERESDEVTSAKGQMDPLCNDIECNVCGKKFLNTLSLRKHKIIHLEKVKCKFCGMLFQQRSLKRHEETVHLGMKKCKCSICGLAFKHYSSLSRHLKTHSQREFEDQQQEVTERDGTAEYVSLIVGQVSSSELSNQWSSSVQNCENTIKQEEDEIELVDLIQEEIRIPH